MDMLTLHGRAVDISERAKAAEHLARAEYSVAVRKARTESGVSLREVARRALISAPYLSDIERGHRFPPYTTACRISAAIYRRDDE